MSPSGSSLACRICGGTLARKFTAIVLGDTRASYWECASCRSLIVPEPTWLERAYTTRIIPDPDQGALVRTSFIHRSIRRLRSGPTRFIGRRSKVLDFGCGYGFLLSLLSQDGHDVAGVDQYPRALFCEDRVSRTLPEERFELIVASEVLEHLERPSEVIAALTRCLAPTGLLLVTTELYDAKRHDEHWHYLVPAHGQHITFFSWNALAALMSRHGLRHVATHRFNDRDFLFLFTPDENRIPPWRAPLLRLRQAFGERVA